MLDLAKNSFSVLPLDGIQAIEATLESVSFEGKPNICLASYFLPDLSIIFKQNQKRNSKFVLSLEKPQ